MKQTAVEFLIQKGIANPLGELWRLNLSRDCYAQSEKDIQKAMIEFAKLHVEAALKEASEAATINKNKGQVTGREFGNVTDGSYSINQPSILNSYPLENIK
jgi:hypothetical protein